MSWGPGDFASRLSVGARALGQSTTPAWPSRDQPIKSMVGPPRLTVRERPSSEQRICKAATFRSLTNCPLEKAVRATVGSVVRGSSRASGASEAGGGLKSTSLKGGSEKGDPTMKYTRRNVYGTARMSKQTNIVLFVFLALQAQNNYLLNISCQRGDNQCRFGNSMLFESYPCCL